jgi:hypothetical protein
MNATVWRIRSAGLGELDAKFGMWEGAAGVTSSDECLGGSGTWQTLFTLEMIVQSYCNNDRNNC